MKVAKTQAEVTNVNPRKENSEDGSRLASDVSVKFTTPLDSIAKLIPRGGFLNQFFSDDKADTRLEVLCPISYGKRIEGLRVTLYCGVKPMVFEGARIAAGAEFMPVPGGFIEVKCKVQVYPTRDQSGKLDEAVKERIDIEIEQLTRDFDDEPEEKAA